VFFNIFPTQMPQQDRRNLVTVKVWPKNDHIRGLLKHPAGVAFSADPQADPAEWPDDQFTTRRIADGDILTEAPKAEPTPKAAKAKAEDK
jgi:hypothetical protein